MYETRAFKLETKGISATGEFTGLASVYGVKDLQGDIVEPGAFKRTLDHKGGEIPILWQHKQDHPIGLGRIYDEARGLMINGQLNLEVNQGREAYALLKQGALKGLSIGYDVQQEGWKNNVRHLKEVRLWEVSLVTIPANPNAIITNVKSAWPFEIALASILTHANEEKAGRKISGANKRLIMQAVEVLQALLASTDTPDPEPLHSDVELKLHELGNEDETIAQLADLFAEIQAYTKRR